MSDNLNMMDVYSSLIETIPELRPRIANELGKYYDFPNEIPGLYPVFEDVVKSVLRASLEKDLDSELSIRLFHFLERMATSDDLGVVTLLRIGILETIAYESAFYVAAQRYMGRKTAEYVELDRRDYERRGVLPS